jgi:RNA polymerase sigma-70 factor (ECF subfamily)
LADDATIWERVRKGDRETFDMLYRTNAPRIRSFLVQLIGNREAAEDLMQDTFLGIWQAPGGFNPELGSISSYLFGIARKRAAEWWRRHAVQTSAVLPESIDARSDTGSVISNAFAQLPEAHRTLLWLREVEGQSYAELAAVLDVPVGTVRSRLFAAREALRGIWQLQVKCKEDL